MSRFNLVIIFIIIMCLKRLSPFTDKLSIDIKYVCVVEYMSGIEFIRSVMEKRSAAEVPDSITRWRCWHAHSLYWFVFVLVCKKVCTFFQWEKEHVDSITFPRNTSTL